MEILDSENVEQIVALRKELSEQFRVSELEAADMISNYVALKQNVSKQVWKFANDLIKHKIESQLVGLPIDQVEFVRSELLMQIGTDFLINVAMSESEYTTITSLMFNTKFKGGQDAKKGIDV